MFALEYRLRQNLFGALTTSCTYQYVHKIRFRDFVEDPGQNWMYFVVTDVSEAFEQGVLKEAESKTTVVMDERQGTFITYNWCALSKYC